MTKTIVKVFLIVLSFYLIACNEQPTELGYKIDSVAFEAVSSNEFNFITEAASERYYLTPFNQGVFQVGKKGAYSSYPIIRYGNIDSLQGAEIVSATLKLINSGYCFGDTNALQSFEIYEVQVPIVPTSTYETVFKANGVDAVYKTTLMGQFEKAYKDISDTTNITLNNQLIQNWIDFSVLENSGNLDTGDIRRKYSYSIGLKPTSNSEVINGFLSDRIGNSGADSPNPSIQLIYRKNGVLDTTILRSNVATFYADGPLPDAQSLTVQSALSYRSMLKFDLSELPKFASVVKAVLKIYVNDSLSAYGSLGRDSVLLAQKDFTFDDTFFPTNDNIYLGIRSTGTNYYKFTSITSAVEDWLKGDKKGTLLFNYAQNSNPSDTYFRFDKFYLYGINAEAGLRPELTIFYAKRPDF